jgi:ABC-2 type transport system permease protein
MVAVGTVLLVMFFSVLFIRVNFSYINSLAGWSFYQIIAVIGSYMIIEGIMWTFMGQLNPINMHIREGTLDGILLKPIDDQFFVTFWRGDWEDSVRIITGSVLLFLAMKNTIGFNFLHVILFLMTLLNGAVILYCFNLMVRSASFWLIDGSGLWVLMERVTTNAQYPVDIYYHKIVKNALTFIIPLAFVSTVPARILTYEKIDWRFFGLSFLTAIVFFAAARWFWKFSLKRYESASS